ncbi:hypothetical protein Tco_1217273 [Tanacetum coccineum]
MAVNSTTTHVDFSQYDSFIFDLSNDQFPPADRSDFCHEEFADELAQIISPPEYDRFCFKIEPELGNLTMDCWIARIVKTLSFVIHQEFHILSFIWESDILILSTNVLSFGIPHKRP